LKKTKNTQRLSAVIVLFAVLLVAFCGCSNQPTVMSYGGSKITTGEFTFYLATYKANFKKTYSDFAETDEFYNMIVDENGTTAEESLFATVVDNVKMMVICDALCKRYQITVPRETTDTINEYLNGLAEQYSNGNANSFNEVLGKYNINKNMLKNIYLRYEKINLLYDYLYGTNGTSKVTADDLNTYLENNYVRVMHIYVNNKFKYLTDEEGVLLYNEDGTYQTAELSGDELSKKNEVISKIDSSLSKGEDFHKVYSHYSEDQYYSNGYYLYPTIDFVSEVVTAAFGLDLGETCKVESSIGTHYLLRLEPEANPWNNEANEDFFYEYNDTVSEWLFNEFLDGLLNEVDTNDELLDKFSLRDSLSNSLF